MEKKERKNTRLASTVLSHNTITRQKEGSNDNMIPQFTDICKRISEKIKKIAQKNSEEEIYEKTVENSKPYEERCPECGAAGRLKRYGCYWRHMVYHEDSKVKDSLKKIKRYKCTSCGRTHALLPDILVPYSPYTLSFKLIVLHAYYRREKSVVKICEYFGIAVSTLYVWKKLLLEHQELLMGVVESKKTGALAFLREYLGSESSLEFLRSFFLKYGFSFLQNRRKSRQSATQSVPP